MSLTNVNGTVCEDYNVNRPLTASNVGFQSLNLSNTTNQLTIGASAHLSTISVIAPVASTQLYTLPDVGGNANFVMTAGNQTIAGVKSFTSGIPITQTTNQLVLGSSSHNAIISSVAPASASLTYTIQDSGASCDILTGLKRVINAVENAITTLTVAQSGCIVYCPQSTHNNSSTINVIDLPAPTAGWNCKIIFQAVGDNTAGHGWQITGTGANLKGTAVGVAGGLVGVLTTGVTNLIRSGTAANAVNGDWVQIDSDGTNMFYYASSTGTATPYSTS
jgi:hypothetical protein